MLLDRNENVSMTIDLNQLTTSNNASRAAKGDVGKNEQLKVLLRHLPVWLFLNRCIYVVFVFLLHTIRYEPTIMCIRPNRIDRRW
jgi:hypothetical protein